MDLKQRILAAGGTRVISMKQVDQLRREALSVLGGGSPEEALEIAELIGTICRLMERLLENGSGTVDDRLLFCEEALEIMELRSVTTPAFASFIFAVASKNWAPLSDTSKRLAAWERVFTLANKYVDEITPYDLEVSAELAIASLRECLPEMSVEQVAQFATSKLRMGEPSKHLTFNVLLASFMERDFSSVTKIIQQMRASKDPFTSEIFFLEALAYAEMGNRESFYQALNDFLTVPKEPHIFRRYGSQRFARLTELTGELLGETVKQRVLAHLGRSV